ncbi:MAG: SDR family oxidoreductase [Candidatus Bathyarchaeia archaeon]|jgi:UDP-glucose 4-epimerase
MGNSSHKVLVTGGAGFIGSHLVDRLLAEGFEVTVLDDFSSGKMQNISHHKNAKELHVVHGDVRDTGLVKNVVEDVDSIFHEAALVDVALSVEEPFLFNDVNVVGTLNLLRVCADSGIKRFVFASSAAVYGISGPAKKREGMLPRPISPYGVTKLASENYVRVFSELCGLETVCLRYFNVYGPRQGVGSSYSGVITAFLSRLLNSQAPVIHGDGRQTRDFVNVDDVVAANMLALKSKNAVGEVFNIASGRATTISDLAKVMQRITEKECLKPVYAEPRPGDIKHCWADITKAERLLGFHPKVKIDGGLLKLVRGHRDAKYSMRLSD